MFFCYCCIFCVYSPFVCVKYDHAIQVIHIGCNFCQKVQHTMRRFWPTLSKMISILQNNQYIFLILKKIIRFHSTINDKITLCALLKIHTTFFSINIPTMHLIFLFYKFLSRSEKNLKNLLFSHFLYISTYLCSTNIKTWSSAPIVD